MRDMRSPPGSSLRPSTGLPEAGPSRRSPESQENLPSRLIDAEEVPSCKINQETELDRHDGFIAQPRLTPTDHDVHSDGHSSSVQRPAEATSSDEVMASLAIDNPHSCSPSEPMKLPEASIPRVNICPPSSEPISELPNANSILPSHKPALTLNPPDGSEGLHQLPFPRHPPEVTALLTAQSAGDVVSLVFARNSPLVPWGLPSEIGHFWLGLFKISEVKVTHACHRQETDLTSLWVCLFARWKCVRGKTPQIHSPCRVSGALLWNGCLVERIYSWMMSRMIIVNGPFAQCGHGGSQKTSRWRKLPLSKVLASCFHFLFSPPLRATLRRVVTSQ
jgi:hypothetical protein